MSVEDLTSFQEHELKEVTLTTWSGSGDGVVYLRSLPQPVVAKFRGIVAEMSRLQFMSDEELKKKYEDDLDRAEQYLVREAICDHQGNLLLVKESHFKTFWSQCVSETINEIVYHIKHMNYLDRGFSTEDQVEELYKKK